MKIQEITHNGKKVNLGKSETVDDYDEFDDGPYFDDKTINKIKKDLKKNVIGQDIVLEKMDAFLD